MSNYCRRVFLGSIVPSASLLVSLCVVSAASAQDDDDGHVNHLESAQQDVGANHAGFALRDATLVTQDDEEVNLAADVIGDRIVIVNFVYTTCTTVCPVLSAIFKQAQARLGDRLGNDVMLVSISVDPLRDTPVRIKEYANKIGAGDGWLWLTGPKQTITQVLEDFGAYTPNFEEHPSMVLVGDGSSGHWARFLGFPNLDQILGKVDDFGRSRVVGQTHAAALEKK